MTDKSTADDADRVLADCLEDFHRRRALAENPKPEDYADRVGERLPELRRIVETEATIDAALGESAPQHAGFPRAFGEYTLVRELGRGAMGVVYEAVHRPLGRAVALKVLRTGLDTDGVALERFRREARACAQVRHPHIVEVYDAGEVDGQPYYSMAVLRGRALQDMAGTAAEPQLPALLRGFANVADALGALHRAGIVHRDVKPSNILVTEDGEMILSDFGLARTAHSERLTSTGQALGTPLYMSPEQMMGRASEIDGRADIYGLGAAMYEIFTGRQLFKFDDVASAMRLILKEQPERPRALRPELPEALENILLKCLEKRKEDRYQDAAALRDDLIALAEGRKVVGRPVSEVKHGWRRVRPFVPAIAAAALVATAGAWMWTHREATIIVKIWPSARLEIDGVDQGEPATAFAAKVAPGRHALKLVQAGFHPRTESVEVGPGEETRVERVIVAEAGEYEVALAQIGKELEVKMLTLAPLSADRSAVEAPVSVLWPRGEVRAEDLATWRIDTADDFKAKGDIEFRAGGKVLAKVPFDPEYATTEGPIPDAVRAAVAPGARVSWGYVPSHGEPVMTDVVVTAKDMTKPFAKMDERTKEQPRAVAAHLRAQMLLKAGLNLAAYNEAKALTDAHPKDRRAWLIMQHALDGMQIRDCKVWREACNGVAACAGEDRAAQRGSDGEPK